MQKSTFLAKLLQMQEQGQKNDLLCKLDMFIHDLVDEMYEAKKKSPDF